MENELERKFYEQLDARIEKYESLLNGEKYESLIQEYIHQGIYSF